MNLGHRVGTWVRVAACSDSQTQSKLVRCGRTQFALEPATTGGSECLSALRPVSPSICLSAGTTGWPMSSDCGHRTSPGHSHLTLAGGSAVLLTFLRSPAGPGRYSSVTAIGSVVHSSVARCGVVAALIPVLAAALRPRWSRR